MIKLRKLPVRCVLLMRTMQIGVTVSVASRYPDLILVPWLLEGRTLYVYLIARITSLVIPFALALLDGRVRPHLEELSLADSHLHLLSAAARVNLGYLLVCGGMAVIVLISTPFLAKMFELPRFDLAAVLIWFVVGQSAPILFGATGLLMYVAKWGTVNEFLLWLTGTLFFVYTVVLGSDSAVMIAQTLAASQLAHAGICALMLTQRGVWPGLTALFHKEIKLF